MENTPPISPRTRLLVFIQAYIETHGWSPTVREIGDALGWHMSHVYWHLSKLTTRGYVAWEPGKSRTLRLLRPIVTVFTNKADL